MDVRADLGSRRVSEQEIRSREAPDIPHGAFRLGKLDVAQGARGGRGRALVERNGPSNADASRRMAVTGRVASHRLRVTSRTGCVLVLVLDVERAKRKR